ncbi:hypothetical protein GCM10023143_06890 [Compostibacter hankyongensis]|uniref:Outer membrane lipoprotein BamD-like domain-containing protein n=1 Tax=Compostibacter hankyongensis TaxID=1007089 RepID=A0ABP8FGX5_9BACT
MLPLLALGACSKLAKIEKSNDVGKKLAYANELYAKKKYNQAQQLYQELLQIYKGTKQAEGLLYNYAYSSYYLKDYEQAAFHFKNFVEVFPNSPKAIEMDYMQAYCYYMLSPRVELDQANTMKAISAMQTFINTHPDAEKVQEATHIIDLCRKKLEKKEENAATLYYDLGYYRAAGITFKNLMRDYPDSESGDRYKLMAIKSYYKYAENSILEKQKERYDQVITEYLDFTDHYANSSYAQEAEKYYTSAQHNLKTVAAQTAKMLKYQQNEQAKEKPEQ